MITIILTCLLFLAVVKATLVVKHSRTKADGVSWQSKEVVGDEVLVPPTNVLNPVLLSGPIHLASLCSSE